VQPARRGVVGNRSGRTPRTDTVEFVPPSGHAARRGLVGTRREKTTIFYRITSERVLPILTELYALFCAGDEAESRES
jgi:hypothetical protein